MRISKLFFLVALGVSVLSGVFALPSLSEAAFDCANELSGRCAIGINPCNVATETLIRGSNCPLFETCCVPRPTGGTCSPATSCQTSCSNGVDITKSCSDNATACCKSVGTVPPPPSAPTPTPTSTPSGSATSSAPAAGSSCDMSKCSTSECQQGTNNSFCAAECKDHFGTLGEYYYCDTTPGGTGSYCSGSENPGLVPCGRSCDDPTTPSDETAICTLCHLLLLIKNIFDWIFMVMTYIAFAVLVAMGILYIVSTGRPQLINVAKSGIWAALVGFAVVLLAWVMVNVVLFVLADGALGEQNAAYSIKDSKTGAWFEFTCDAASKYKRTGVNGSGGAGTTPTGTGGNLNCKDGKCANMQDVANAAQSNASGVESDIVMAIVDAGEGCNKSLSSDGYGSCGYSQALPSIRAKCGITGSASESCTKIQNDVQLDINCAAWLIRDNAGRCGMDIRNVASCYNSGRPNNCANTTNRYCDRVETYYKSCKE